MQHVSPPSIYLSELRHFAFEGENLGEHPKINVKP